MILTSKVGPRAEIIKTKINVTYDICYISVDQHRISGNLKATWSEFGLAK